MPNTNLYHCLSQNQLTKGLYKIVPYREEDIFNIKTWRNEQMEVLRQNKVLTDEDQRNYYNQIVVNSFHEDYPRIILFSFLKQEKCIGYGGLTNIDWTSQRAEISFLVQTERTVQSEIYKEDFSTFIQFMKRVNFEILSFNRLFTETFDIRAFHISILEEEGFMREGCMKEHVKIGGKFVDSIIHGFIKSYYDTGR